MMRTKRRARRVSFFPFLALMLLAVICAVIWRLWDQQQPRFQDAFLELGQPMPDITVFLTEKADPEDVVLVSKEIPIDQVGRHPVTLRCGNKEETVILTVQDTTPPSVVFRSVSVAPGTAVEAVSFVESVSDPSNVTVSFTVAPQIQDIYTDVTAVICVTDAYGNKTEGDCTLHYTWLKDSYTLELGTLLTKEDLLLDQNVDKEVLDQAAVDHISYHGLAEYEIGGDYGGITCVCKVKVVDTTAPLLTLQELSIHADQTVSAEDFVLSLSDASNDVTLKILTELKLGVYGTQDVQIQAVDPSGNTTVVRTKLHIVENAAPVFSELEDIVLSKYTIPDYREGVTVTDDFDGDITFTYDDSKVDLMKAGTYYVTYRAVDSAGNETTRRRRVIVEGDAQDTAVLVALMAQQCGDDPRAITDFVRSKIYYNSNDWGGEDPVHTGFTKFSGNCMVSARCLQALLEYKGYNTQLIWVKEEFDPHYWVIVEIEPGVWRHVDATRGVHAKIPYPMTDEQRLQTLVINGVQRVWDTEKWPACV